MFKGSFSNFTGHVSYYSFSLDLVVISKPIANQIQPCIVVLASREEEHKTYFRCFFSEMEDETFGLCIEKMHSAFILCLCF